MIKFEKLLIAILLLSIFSCAKNEKKLKEEKTNPKQENGIKIGFIDTINSKILKQKRELVIYIPESAKDPNRKRDEYPVVYLLDGDYNFLPLVGMLKQYSEMNDTQILPEMIVVGIPNIDNDSRWMDFSPTTAGKPEQYGGGNKFLEFMKTELFPYIEQNYSGSQNRTIIGHSFGGLVVMNALTTHQEMFTNYLLIDGSLYFDEELFFNNPNYSLKGKDLKNKNLYIGIANTATYGSDLESIRKDTIRANKYVRYSLKLVDEIESLDTNLNMEWKYYENDTHGSTAFLSQMEGFRFFYSWFEFKDEHKYRGKSFIPKTVEDHFANLTKSHFKLVSQKIGYTFKPEEQWVRLNAGMLLDYHKLPKQALENYKLNQEYYPNSPSVYKDLADYYLLQNDTILAKKYYTKTLELEDNSGVEETLKKLGT
ncbi:alpha/beta hydrolase [Bizionia argentinensis JUB59]|uniref:Alpha/beta hydrolase n=1 Tax=Bizionia argentinensis JUB59 TaxID=1046627 RepID=G2EHR6_9FLAO|nr:alpha/beta hydrolase-fold protein [Bizionia argentinensis]EGV42043.1 alpha/beta hydrolase [Bizionia argentinensis JUB59]